VLLQLVENACNCLIKIVDSVYQSSELLDELCKHGLIQHVTLLLSSNGQTTLSEPTYYVSNFFLSIIHILNCLMKFLFDVNVLFCLPGIDRTTCQTFIWIICSLQKII